MLYQIKIDPTSLGGSAPSDGFIDPSTIKQYRQRIVYTGTVANPTVVNPTSILVNGVEVTVTGTAIANIISAINAKSFYHHVFASNDSGKLVLTTLPGYDNMIPSLLNNDQNDFVTAVGFKNPVKTTPFSYAAQKANAIKKERANIRWKLVLEAIQLTGNCNFVVTNVASADEDTDATMIKFLVDVDDTYYNYDFNGNQVYGALALRNAIAKTLMYEVRRKQTYYDPTDTESPNGRFVAEVTEEIHVGALTSNQSTAYNAVTVDVLNLTVTI